VVLLVDPIKRVSPRVSHRGTMARNTSVP
jgi:hypothetical protein